MAEEKKSEEFPFECDVDVEFPTAEAAGMVEQALSVDKELQPEKIQRSFRVDGAYLKARFQATEARLLRVSLSSFYDMLSVCLRTLQEFDESEPA